MRFLRLILGPITTWLASIAKALSPGGVDEDGYLGKERLRDLVDRASEGEDLDEESAELISSVIDLEETSVRSVMVPRTDMVVLDLVKFSQMMWCRHTVKSHQQNRRLSC